MDFMSCAEATSTWPVVLFLFGSVAMGFVVKANAGLTVSQTLSALVGVRRIKRNAKINILQAATLIIPIGLWVYLIQICGASTV